MAVSVFIFPNSVYKAGDGTYHDNTNIQVQDGNAGFWTSATANTNIATNYYGSAAAVRLRRSTSLTTCRKTGLLQ